MQTKQTQEIESGRVTGPRKWGQIEATTHPQGVFSAAEMHCVKQSCVMNLHNSWDSQLSEPILASLIQLKDVVAQSWGFMKDWSFELEIFDIMKRFYKFL